MSRVRPDKPLSTPSSTFTRPFHLLLTLPVEVTWAGTGCPPGSASADLAEGGTLVSLAFSKYVAATGTGQSASDARKNCDVRITLHYPQGWSYTVASTDLRGYALIPAGCSARLGATFFFSGQSNDVSQASWSTVASREFECGIDRDPGNCYAIIQRPD